MPSYSFISAFDLDHTLFKGNSSYFFGAFLYKKRYFSFFKMLVLLKEYLLHRIGLVSLQDLHVKIFKKIFVQRDYPLIEDYLDHFLDQNFDNLINLPIFNKLKQAQHDGHYTIILSSSPSFIVEKIANRLQVDSWQGSNYELNQKKQFLKVGSVLDGKAKASILKSLRFELKVPQESVIAYSDSLLDLEFLQAAGKKVVVNPDKALRAIAKENQWLIIQL